MKRVTAPADRSCQGRGADAHVFSYAPIWMLPRELGFYPDSPARPLFRDLAPKKASRPKKEWCFSITEGYQADSAR